MKTKMEAPVENEALVTQGPTTMAVFVGQDLLDHAGKGTENIQSEDCRPPVLRICQGQTPQRKLGNPKFIDGLTEPNIFNDLTEENYRNGPVKFVVVSQLGESAIIFPSKESGYEEIVFDIPMKRIPGTKPVRYEDERLNFTKNVQGDLVKPVATKFVNFLVYLLDTQELVALALKGSQLKSATTMNSLLKYPVNIDGKLIPNPPSWARVFSMSTAMDKKDGNDFSATTIKQAGIAPVEVRAMAAQLHEYYAGKKVVIRHDESEGVVDAASDEY